jgi:hypothetical protein
VELASEGREQDRGRRRRLGAWLLAGALALVLAARVAAVFTANVHWDEFALLHLADRTHATGVLQAGGRPGLAVVTLLPFVAHCDDEIQVIRRARLLWTALALAFVAGVAVWISQLAPPGRGGWREAGLAAALLAAVPAFLDASIQIRTDQIALAGGAWGGAALLASRRRPALALAAGALFAVGLLGSQKVLYLAVLAGLLAAGDQGLARELRPRREALRLLAGGAGFVAVLWAFGAGLEHAFQVPAAAPVRRPISAAFLEQGFSLFAFYRETIGFAEYREMLPTLGAHAVLLAGLLAASWAALRRRRFGDGRLALAWAVLFMGLAVGLFHAAAFGYFWMTLGLFPAIGLALALEPIRELGRPLPPRGRRLVAAGFWCLLALPGSLHLGALLTDTQAVQRESLAFVHRNFDRSAAGFHPESALFCQEEAQPTRTWFSQHIYRRFAGDGRQRNTERMLRNFRETPVEFILQSFRLDQFPPELRRFWAENYQPYRASVFVAGRRFGGERGTETDFELIVPGRYRWIPVGGPRRVAIDGRLVAAGEVVTLDRGSYAARFVDPVPDGMLVLALDEPPGRAPLQFYR